MALYSKVRTEAQPALEYTDEVVRTCFVWNAKDQRAEVWQEWNVERTHGKPQAVSVRCDPEVEAEILALPNVALGLLKASENTHPKVTGNGNAAD